MTRRGWVLFLSMGAIWGVPYLLIKVAVDELAPSVLVLARTTLAGLLLLPVALARGHLRALIPSWLPILALAAIENRSGRCRLLRADRRGRADPLDGDHLPQPDGGPGARRGGPRH